jgi:hypothetical protein
MRLSSGAGWSKGRWNERGFTMGEVLMVASLLTFVSTGLMSLLSRGHKGQKQSEEMAYQEMFSKGRGAVNRMVEELDQAGTPAVGSIEGLPETSPANTNRVAAARYLVATPTQLVFEADLDHDGAVERVDYRLNGSTLERSAVSKNSDGTAPEARYEAVIGNVDNGAMPLFSYAGDPFGVATPDGGSDAVRILLLLRAPARKSFKQTAALTVGFEGVAHRPSAVASRQNKGPDQSLLQDAQSDSDVASSELPVQEKYSNRWTLR